MKNIEWLAPVCLCLLGLARHAALADSGQTTLAANKTSSVASDDSDLRTRFFAEYPAAVERLKQAVGRLRCKGRYRSMASSDSQEPWLDFSVLTYDGKLRFELKVSKYSLAVPVSEAFLVTPGLAAKVCEPRTESAWLEYEGAEPSIEMRISLARFMARFLFATYSDDGACILDEISHQRVTVQSVTRHPKNPDFVVVECTHRDLGGVLGDDPKYRAEGTLTLVLSPKQDWAIRELRMTSMPYAFESRSEVDVFKLADGGFVPRKCQIEVFSLSTPRKLKEKYQFEMSEMAVLESVAPEEFSLEALGVHRPARSWRPVVFTVVSVVLLVSLIVSMWLRRGKAFRWRAASRH